MLDNMETLDQMKKFILFFLFFFCFFSFLKNGIAEEVITNSLGMRFVQIYPGTFKMGSPKSETGHRWNEKEHTVRISKSFYMQETEVTQGQWKKLVGFNPSSSKAKVNSLDSTLLTIGDSPAETGVATPTGDIDMNKLAAKISIAIRIIVFFFIIITT